MNLFIDTNIFLSFYHLTSDDLEELTKLTVIAKRGDANLLLTGQVIDEFRRNRANKLADAMKKLRDQKLPIQFPQICRQYEEYDELRQTLSECDRLLSRLIDRIGADIEANALQADSVVEGLFTASRLVVPPSREVDRARLRVDLGNPPGKRGSLGDAINWEQLLEHVPDGEDLHFLTEDSDYFSPLDANAFHPYLLHEWSSRKHSELIVFKRLSAFLASQFPDIELETELEKERLIEELAQSRKFAQTRGIVKRLAALSDISVTQANDILEAAVTNNQIYWIADTPEVKSFLTSIIDRMEPQLEQDNMRRLRYVFDEMPHYGRIPF